MPVPIDDPRFGPGAHLLVTGGAGFIGSAFVREVLGRGDGTRITLPRYGAGTPSSKRPSPASKQTMVSSTSAGRRRSRFKTRSWVPSCPKNG